MSAIDERGAIVAVLRGHLDTDIAYVQDDYPYGAHRCKRRLWIEKATKGTKKGQYRLMMQTTNPKRPGEYWNKPHSTQYSAFLFMVQFENGHVDAETLSHPWSSQWIDFYNRGFWHMLNADERKQIAYAVRLLRSGDTTGWNKFANDLTEIRAADLRTEDDWKRATIDGRIQSLYADFERLRRYADNDGPDVTTKRWWELPADLVDLDA